MIIDGLKPKVKIPVIKILGNVTLYVAALSLGISIGNTLNAWKDFYEKKILTFIKKIEKKSANSAAKIYFIREKFSKNGLMSNILHESKILIILIKL